MAQSRPARAQALEEQARRLPGIISTAGETTLRNLILETIDDSSRLSMFRRNALRGLETYMSGPQASPRSRSVWLRRSDTHMAMTRQMIDFLLECTANPNLMPVESRDKAARNLAMVILIDYHRARATPN